LSELKAAKGDLGAVMLVNAKVRGIARITQKFVQKGDYNDLPTDAEKAQAEKELREDSVSQEAHPEKIEEQTTEQTVEPPTEKTEAKTDTGA
jgi:hypothetical protein